MPCAICRTRRPRRYCPGVHADICTTCCGSEREVTVDCPFDCEYLIQAHQFERPETELAPLVHPDIEITEDFVIEHEQLLAILGAGIGLAAEQTPGSVDSDVREALESLVETYKTMDKGVFYEHIPQNPLAASVFRFTQQAIQQMRDAQAENRAHATRDGEVLRALVFLLRIANDRDNGRKRCRAFLGMLRQFHSRAVGEAPASPLILP